MAKRARSPLVPALAALALAGAACGGGGSDPPPPIGDVGDPCTSASRCRAGLVCFEGLCATEAPAAAACAPAGHVPSIVDGGVLPIVQADYVGCVNEPRLANPGATAVSLDVHQVGAQLYFEIPAGTASFSIVSQESPGTAVDDVTLVYQGNPYVYANAPVPNDVRLPGGALFYDDMDSWFSDPSRYGALDAYAFGFAPQAGAFTHPSTSAGIDRLYSAGGADAGTWRLTVNDYARSCLLAPLSSYCDAGSVSGRYDVKVLRKPGPITSTGTLDLSVILVSQSLTSAQARTSTQFARYVTSLQALFGQAGICLGTVRVYDMPAWAVDRWWSIDADDTSPCGNLSQLFTTSPGESAVHVFLVDDLYSASAPPSSTVVGLDGSIPGPSGVSGTIVSGAAVELGSNLDPPTSCSSFDPASCDPDFLAYVTAHEAGHWLGLFHVTEAYAGLWDPLDDTPTCDCICAPLADRTSCTNGTAGGELEVSYCLSSSTCGGGDNLMFWLFQDGYSVGDLSPEQGRVMRLNPAVR